MDTEHKLAVKNYFWGVISAVIIIVLSYLIIPMNDDVKSNRKAINSLSTRVSVIETEINYGFKNITQKLGKIDEKLDKIGG